ncbi:MAG: hypothetical protein ACE5HA_02705 [Anaerolineae bacterium]
MAQNRRATVAREMEMLGCLNHWPGGTGKNRFMTYGRTVHSQPSIEQIGQDERKTMATG